MSPRDPLIKNVIAIRGGFLQNQGDLSGTVRAHARLHHRFAGPDTLVLWYPWDTPSSQVAEFIWRITPDKEYTIVLIGYSWGGAAAVRDCWALKDRGRGVESLVVSDAVYRPLGFRWAWTPIQLAVSAMALTPNPVIVVPANVRNVHAFRQKRGIFVRDGNAIFGWAVNPQGHKLVREDTGGEVPEVVSELHYVTHRYMDDLQAFHAKADEEVARALDVPFDPSCSARW